MSATVLQFPGRRVAAAYVGVLDSPCPTCGADVGEFCTVTDAARVTRIRRMPCVRRCRPAGPPAEAPSRSARSFSEPLRGGEPAS